MHTLKLHKSRSSSKWRRNDLSLMVPPLELNRRIKMDQVGFGQKSLFKIMQPVAKSKVQISGHKIASDLLLMSSIIVTDDQFKGIGWFNPSLGT